MSSSWVIAVLLEPPFCGSNAQVKLLAQANCPGLMLPITFDLLRLKAAGIQGVKSSIGSTPSCSHPVADMAMLSEVHPGNYVFYGQCHFRLSPVPAVVFVVRCLIPCVCNLNFMSIACHESLHSSTPEITTLPRSYYRYIVKRVFIN